MAEIVLPTGRLSWAARDLRRRSAARRRWGGGDGGGAAGAAYTLPTPIVVHSFNSTTGWFPTNGSTAISIAVDGGMLRFNDLSPNGSATATNHNVINGDPATWGTLVVESELGSDPDLQMTAGVLRLGSGGSGGSGGTFNSSASFGGVPGGTSSDYYTGKYWGHTPVSALSGLPAAGNIGLRTETSNSPGGRDFRIRRVLANAAGRPTVLLTFDDAWPAQAGLALTMMNYYGFRGTVYTPWGLIDTHGRMTLAQVQTLRDAGWAICLDGHPNSGSMLSAANAAAAITLLNEGRAWLAANGFAAEGGNHICYPNGEFRGSPGGSNGITRTIKTDVTASVGSPVLTMGSTSGINVNDRAVGVAIPNSPVTRVASVDSGTQVTLTAPVTVAMTGAGRVKFVNDNLPFHSDKLQAALRAAGFKSARNTLGGTIYSRYGVGDMGLQLPGSSSTSATAATLINLTQAAVNRGTTVCIYFHAFAGGFNPIDGTDDGTPTSGMTMGTGAFNPFLADLRARVNANQVDVLTVPQWWARDCETPATPPG